MGLFTNPNSDDGFEPEKINNIHYHAQCDLEEYCIPHARPQREIVNGSVYYRVNKFEGFKCRTHGVVVHKDGWEVGWWGGTSSKALNEEADRSKYLRRSANRRNKKLKQ